MAHSKSDICIIPKDHAAKVKWCHIWSSAGLQPYTDWNKWIYFYGMMLLLGDKKGLTWIRGHPQNPIEWKSWRLIPYSFGSWFRRDGHHSQIYFLCNKATAKAFIIMGGDRI